MAAPIDDVNSQYKWKYRMQAAQINARNKTTAFHYVLRIKAERGGLKQARQVIISSCKQLNQYYLST